VLCVSDAFGGITVYDIKLQQQPGVFTFDLDMGSERSYHPNAPHKPPILGFVPSRWRNREQSIIWKKQKVYPHQFGSYGGFRYRSTHPT